MSSEKDIFISLDVESVPMTCETTVTMLDVDMDRASVITKLLACPDGTSELVIEGPIDKMAELVVYGIEAALATDSSIELGEMEFTILSTAVDEWTKEEISPS